MFILSLGTIAEVRIPKDELDKYSSQQHRDMRVRAIIADFITNNIKTIANYSVCITQNFNNHFCEINDFNYSHLNQVEQNQDCYVFRMFGLNLICIANDNMAHYNNLSQTYNHNGYEYNLCISSTEFKEIFV